MNEDRPDDRGRDALGHARSANTIPTHNATPASGRSAPSEPARDAPPDPARDSAGEPPRSPARNPTRNAPPDPLPDSPLNASPPRLLDRVRQEIRVRHYSRRTEEAYVGWIRKFILFHHKHHPDTMGEPEVSAFLTWLAVTRKVSAVTQTQALSAIIFLYKEVLRRDLGWIHNVARAKTPRRLPVVLTREEVRALLRHLDGAEWLVAAILYGAGLRLLEGLRLRVKDVDFGAKSITVRSGKGQKDRITMLPGAIQDPLRRHLEVVHLQHQRDLDRGAGYVELPVALARKYPNAPRDWGWQWVFPATRTYVDPITRQRRRHHLHETVLQKSMRRAVLAAHLTKLATCHTLRHSFATHLLQGVAFLPCHTEGTEAPSTGVPRAA